MSTALIGGLALQGTPKDYTNIATRKEQAAGRAAAQAQRERDALDKQILGALTADAHPGVLEELEVVNSDGMRRVYDLYAGGDLNAARAALVQLKNNNEHVARTSKQLYEFERFSSQGGYHFPAGWSEFVRSPEFRSGGESRVKAAEEFFNREENQPYKSLFGVGLDAQGRFTIAYDANVGKKLDADNVFTSKAKSLMGQAFIQDLGEKVGSQKFRLGGTNVLQNVRRLSIDRGVEIFDQEAANPTFLYNAAMSEPGLFAPKDSEEYDAAKRRFVERNLPATVKEYIDRFSSGGSGSRRNVVGQATTGYTLPFKIGSDYKSYPVPATYPLADKPGTFNLVEGSFRINEQDQYSRTTGKGGQAEQLITVSNVSIIPVYTGNKKTINTGVTDEDGAPIVINLEPGTPLPVEELDRLYKQNRAAAAAIGNDVTYKYEAFIIGEGQGRESTGSRVDTHMIPMTPANRNKLAALTRNPVFGQSDWKSIFEDKSTLIGRTGRVGVGQGGGTSSGGGQQRQQAAPAPQGGASQQRGAGNPGISKLTPIN